MLKTLSFLFFLVLCHCSFFKTDDVILRVGEVPFSEKYFADRLVEKLKNVDGLHIKNKDLIDSLSLQLEQELIHEGLLLTWARKNNITIDGKAMMTFLNESSSNKNGAPTDFILEEKPDKDLLQNHLRIQLIKSRFLSELQKKISISDEELAAEYKARGPFMSHPMVRVQQILVSSEEDARSVLSKLNGGSNFEEMARKFSLSPEGQSGGNIGWLEKNTSAHFAALLTSPVGMVRKVFSGPGGFYLYKVLEVKKSTPQSFAVVKDQLHKQLLEKKTASAQLLWLEEQVKTSKVYSNERLIHNITSHYQETL